MNKILTPFSIRLILVLMCTYLLSCDNSKTGTKESDPEKNTSEPITNALNTLSEQEKSEGWKLLFDGVTTDGWRNFKSDSIGSAWKVEDGLLYLDDSIKSDWQIVDGGDIITREPYENYVFSLEWKIEEGGNSGIIYNVVESDEYEYVWQTGPEMQILDNERHPDGKIIKHLAGDLYDMISCDSITVKPPGQWNLVRIVNDGGRIEHWLNGRKVVEYDMNTPAWPEMIRNSKFNEMPGFGKSAKGHIALQDHGDMVWYRNIKILEK